MDTDCHGVVRVCLKIVDPPPSTSAMTLFAVLASAFEGLGSITRTNRKERAVSTADDDVV